MSFYAHSDLSILFVFNKKQQRDWRVSFYAHSDPSILFVFNKKQQWDWRVSFYAHSDLPINSVRVCSGVCCQNACIARPRARPPARARARCFIRARARTAQIRAGNPAPAGAREILRPAAQCARDLARPARNKGKGKKGL